MPLQDLNFGEKRFYFIYFKSARHVIKSNSVGVASWACACTCMRHASSVRSRIRGSASGICSDHLPGSRRPDLDRIRIFGASRVRVARHARGLPDLRQRVRDLFGLSARSTPAGPGPDQGPEGAPGTGKTIFFKNFPP